MNKTNTLNINTLRKWLGKTRTQQDILTPQPCNFLAATLDQTRPPFEAGEPLPPLRHWLYFLDARPRHELGRDGHPQRGGFLPPVALPRRMWAGGRIEFHSPLLIGQTVTKQSEITAIERKTGRSGELCFVTVRHTIGRDAPCLIEEHDIVYREDPQPKRPAQKSEPAVETPGARARECRADPTLLFRYSALTFNGHRVHYDADYAREVEGYPDLIVHGPLLATLLADFVTEEKAAVLSRFEFRIGHPIFADRPFTLNTADGKGWVADAEGRAALKAEFEFVD